MTASDDGLVTGMFTQLSKEHRKKVKNEHKIGVKHIKCMVQLVIS